MNRGPTFPLECRAQVRRSLGSFRGSFGARQEPEGLLARGVELVDDFARAGVVELLAGLVLNLVGIVLEARYVLLEQIVFVLELLHLRVEGTGLMALALIDGDAVGPEDHVVGDGGREERSASGAELAAIQPAGLEHGAQARDAGADSVLFRGNGHTYSREGWNCGVKRNGSRGEAGTRLGNKLTPDRAICCFGDGRPQDERPAAVPCLLC